MDASPKGGVDWIMSGATIMKVSDLVSAFRQANALCYEVDEAATAIIVEELASKLQIHQGVPAAVGSGRAGLKYKMHAVAHSMRLQTESWSSVVKLLNATWSWTGDLGVEASVTKFHMRIDALFPWANGDIGGSDGAGGDDGGVADFEYQAEPGEHVVHGGAAHGDAEDAGMFDFMNDQGARHDIVDGATYIRCSRSVFVAGVLHVIHNITKDFSKVTEYFDEWVTSLTQVCALLSRKWTRAWLLATCFTQLPQSAFRDDFSGFNQ